MNRTTPRPNGSSGQVLSPEPARQVNEKGKLDWESYYHQHCVNRWTQAMILDSCSRHGTKDKQRAAQLGKEEKQPTQVPYGRKLTPHLASGPKHRAQGTWRTGAQGELHWRNADHTEPNHGRLGRSRPVFVFFQQINCMVRKSF